MSLHAFLATAGTPVFDSTAGGRFLIAAVVVPAGGLAAAEAQLDAARARHFGTGPLRPGTGADPAGAADTAFLEDGLPAGVVVHAVAVDKHRLGEAGFRDPGSFDAFLNQLLYAQLHGAAPALTLAIDEGDAFLRQFRAFAGAQHPPDLFGGLTFREPGPGESPLLPGARFLAAALRRSLDGVPGDGEGARLREVLQPRIAGLRLVPGAPAAGSGQGSGSAPPDSRDAPDTEYNPTVAALAVQTARQFIDTAIPADEDGRDQVACAKLLLLYFGTQGAGRYLAATEILRHLNERRPEPLTLRRFQTKTIAPLRDAGVLVVSSASGEQQGYKLPSSLEDLHKYIRHSNSMILPLLARVRIFRDALRAASGSAIDLLDRPEFAGLQRLLDR